MEQCSTLLPSSPKQQNNHVILSDRQHSGLDVASFIHTLMFEWVSNTMLLVFIIIMYFYFCNE